MNLSPHQLGLARYLQAGGMAPPQGGMADVARQQAQMLNQMPNGPMGFDPQGQMPAYDPFGADPAAPSFGPGRVMPPANSVDNSLPGVPFYQPNFPGVTRGLR